MSSTLYVILGMICMGNVSEVLVLHIVSKAELELPFGSRAKTALVGRLVSIDGKPTYPLSYPVYRDTLNRSMCGTCGTW